MSLPDDSPPAPRQRSWLYASIACVLGILIAVGLLEAALRVLPVREAFETQPVNRESPYVHFKPNTAPLFSMGWNFEIVNRVRINNYGFVNDQDYDPGATGPLLAVIGDSYVEAAHVPYRDTVHGRLAAAVGDKGRVYSFAASGSPLSQYLAYAQLARDRFRPAALAVVVVGNDFDESLADYAYEPGFHHLRRTAGGDYRLELVPFEPSTVHRIARASALARYVSGNGFLAAAKRRLQALTGDGGGADFVGNVAGEADPERLRKSREAVDFFLANLSAYGGVPPARIVLVVDAERPEVYDPAALQAVRNSYFSLMRAYLIERARAAGYKVADLQPRFAERHARDGTRFEWRIDAHWNAAGHEEAARAVIESGLIADVFGAPR